MFIVRCEMSEENVTANCEAILPETEVKVEEQQTRSTEELEKEIEKQKKEYYLLLETSKLTIAKIREGYGKLQEERYTCLVVHCDELFLTARFDEKKCTQFRTQLPEQRLYHFFSVAPSISKAKGGTCQQVYFDTKKDVLTVSCFEDEIPDDEPHILPGQGYTVTDKNGITLAGYLVRIPRGGRITYVSSVEYEERKTKKA